MRDDDDSDDLEEEIESLIEKFAQILHIFKNLIAFLLGDELVKFFYATSIVLVFVILIRYCFCHCKKKAATKSLKESDNGDSLDSSAASDARESLGWFPKYRLNLGLES